MPALKKIDLGKVNALLTAPCPQCGYRDSTGRPAPSQYEASALPQNAVPVFVPAQRARIPWTGMMIDTSAKKPAFGLQSSLTPTQPQISGSVRQVLISPASLKGRAAVKYAR